MKKIYLFIAVFASLCTRVQAQLTADDAKGQSAVVYKSTSLGFNITDAAVSANWNNFNRLDIAQKKYFLWGLTASTKNKDGLANLFKSGDFTPESKIGGFLGMRWNGHASDIDLAAERTHLQSLPVYVRYIAATSYKAMVGKIIADFRMTTADAKKLTDILEPLTSRYRDPIATILPKIQNQAFDPSANFAVQMILDSLQARETLINKLQPEVTKIQAKETFVGTELTKSRKSTITQAYTIYINGGFNGNSLNFYDPTVTTSLAGRFDTVAFRGGFIDIGFNMDHGPHWTFGISVGYEHYNNIDSLTKTDYSIKTSETIGSDQLSSSKSYSAFKGAYVVYDRSNIKTDALYFGKINDDYRLVWNTLYTRFFIPIKESRIKTVINAGSSINFYKAAGKIVGGFYLQSNDVFNKMESKDTFGGRLSFGVVAKYSFDSIVDRFR